MPVRPRRRRRRSGRRGSGPPLLRGRHGSELALGPVADEITLEEFFDRAPAWNPNASLITGVICGVRVEDIEDPLMQKVRYLDKLVDEVARGKKMTSILRGETAAAS